MNNKAVSVLSERDVCIVIATYNRSNDLDQTLKKIYSERNVPGNIIVVDQSKNKDTLDVVKKHKKLLPIKYIHLIQPSSSMAKNKGISEAKKRFQIILVLDDDVDLLKGFLKEMLKVFNENKKIMALGGADPNPIISEPISKINNLFFKIFFLPTIKNNKYEITGPYGINACKRITKDVRDAEWLSGFNMAFRREVFKDYKMPESKGYNVLEDIDSSYYIFKKYGQNSLIITPKCRVHHRISGIARYKERKRIFINHEDHFYFYYKYFNYPSGTIKLCWSLLGIIIGNFLNYLIKPTKENFSALKYNVEAIFYSIKNRKNTKNGKLRNFLNDDLSMKI